MTEMMCSAFSHAYSTPTPRLSSSSPHPREHLLDMGDRRLRQDAVAQIEDEGLLRERRKHVVDRPIERGAPCQQRQRIEIALHGSPGLDLLARKAAVDHP